MEINSITYKPKVPKLNQENLYQNQERNQYLNQESLQIKREQRRLKKQQQEETDEVYNLEDLFENVSKILRGTFYKCSKSNHISS